VSGEAATVLVADDEMRLLRLMERVLASHGHAVLTARDGNEALRAFEAHREEIEVAVLDASIVPDGAAPIVEALLEARPDLGVVVTSGGLRADEPSPLRRPGVLWLPKPFAADALARAVAEARAPRGGKR
jgi:two-component system, cell cycle sensor histidine kinase and response regulator CckA